MGCRGVCWGVQQSFDPRMHLNLNNDLSEVRSSRRRAASTGVL